MQLNPEQHQAATTLDGDVIVDAGAGSGKTRAMTQRFVNAVAPGPEMNGRAPVAIDSIVSITFTEKAAAELTERIRLALHSAGESDLARRIDTAWISTIHGFCSRILRDNAIMVGLDPLFGVADDVVAGQLAERAFDAACEQLLQAGHPHIERLLDDYSYDGTKGMVLRLSRELAKRGADVSSVEIESSRDLRKMAGESAIYFADAVRALETCGDEGALVQRRLLECKAFVASVRTLLESDLSDVDLATEIIAAASAIGSGKRSTKRSGELLPQTAEYAAHLVIAAATYLASESARTLIELTELHLSHYETLKTERAVLDFDDLQRLAAAVLRDDSIAREYRDAFSLVMVDEFQDTDELQLGLISRVCDGNLFTVGDERQSIYRFRGADVDVYRRHRNKAVHRGIRPITFADNYRSHRDVIAFVNRVFGSDDFFGDDLIRLRAVREEHGSRPSPAGPRIELMIVDQPGREQRRPRAVEAAGIAERFAALRERGFKPNEMVVLLRSWRHAEAYAAPLRAAGFEVIVGGGAFFELPEVALVRLLLRAIANPHDEEALVAVLTSPLVGMTASGLWALSRRVEGSSDVWEAMRQPEGLSEHDLVRVELLTRALDRARSDQMSQPLGTVILRALEDLDYDVVLFSESSAGVQELANIQKLAGMAHAYEEGGGSGIAGFLSYLNVRERLAGGEAAATLADDGSPAVRIMSVHGSKGLEFPVVAVAGLCSNGARSAGDLQMGWNGDSLEVAVKAKDACKAESPWFSRLKESDREADAEEAKRLLYVAATRAKDVLVMSGIAGHAKFGENEGPLASIAHALGVDSVPEESQAVIVEPDPRDETASPFEVQVTGVPEEDCERPESTSVVRKVDEGCDMAARAIESAEQDTGFEMPASLSYSALAQYQKCAHRFWVERVLRAGSLADQPSGGADALDFGSAMHAALQLSVEAGERIAEERFTAIARYHRLDESQCTQLGQAVGRFLESDLYAELKDMGALVAENPFCVSLGDDTEEFLLAGSMDLFTRDGERARIVDYKSGTSGGPEELKRDYDIQAKCYAFAALRAGASEVVVTIVRPEVTTPDGLEHVDFGPFGSVDMARIEDELLELRRAMLRSEFDARPDKSRCRACPVGRVLCEHAYG